MVCGQIDDSASERASEDGISYEQIRMARGSPPSRQAQSSFPMGVPPALPFLAGLPVVGIDAYHGGEFKNKIDE